MNEHWGTFALGEPLSTRRDQQLGLRAAIRHYNEASVPGMGGIGFPMPLIWSLIGVKLAASLDGVPAINVANAIEAKVMLEAIANESDNPRILGRQKLPRQNLGKGSFTQLSKKNTYVTQPYRQACAQPLMEFSLVKSSGTRFNAFTLSERGEAFLAPFKTTIKDLENWTNGSDRKRGITNEIAPDKSLPKETADLLRRLIFNEGNGAARRRAIRDASDALSAPQILSGNVSGLDDDHFNDLQVGIALVRLRNLGISVLDSVESLLRKKRDNREPAELSIEDAMAAKAVQTALHALRHPDGGLFEIAARGDHPEIKSFSHACLHADQVVLEMVKRDMSALQLRDGKIVPGPAFNPPKPNTPSSELRDDTDENETPNFSPELPRLARFHNVLQDLETTQ